MKAFSFDETIECLEGLYHQRIVASERAGLERARTLLSALDNPERAFRSVHVAGTSGKGSTTIMLASILRAAGFTTGCFSSPHLQSYRERIVVDGEPISEDDWVRIFSRVWPIVETMRGNSLPGYSVGRPALFEVLFAMMTYYFRERAVEWAAVEAGLGGRLDATNVLSSDVAIITNISVDHTAILWRTVESIVVLNYYII